MSKLKFAKAEKQNISNMMNTLKQGIFFVPVFPEHCLLPENFSIELTV